MFLWLHVRMCLHVSTYICQSVSPNPDLSSRQCLRIRYQFRLGHRVCVQSLCRFSFFFVGQMKTSIQDPLRTTCLYHTLLALYTHSCAPSLDSWDNSWHTWLLLPLTFLHSEPSCRTSVFPLMLLQRCFAFPKSKLNWLVGLWDKVLEAN